MQGLGSGKGKTGDSQRGDPGGKLRPDFGRSCAVMLQSLGFIF